MEMKWRAFLAACFKMLCPNLAGGSEEYHEESLSLHFNSEDGDNIFLRNVDWLSTAYMALYPRRENSDLFNDADRVTSVTITGVHAKWCYFCR
jgi:hypothetical protein